MATRSPNAGEQTGEVHGDIKPEVHTPRGKAVERTGLTLRSASQEDTEMRRNAHETDSKLSGSFQKAFQKALVLVEKALVLVGWRESPPQPGYKRFRWKNGCGQERYDDYIELEPGALEWLKQQLNGPSASSSR